MDNVISKGIFISAAVSLISYGVSALEENFLYALAAVFAGVLLLVGREVLKDHGYEVGSAVSSLVSLGRKGK